MGLARPSDPYGMTASPAWVEADEEVMRTYAGAFAAISQKVQSQLREARGESSHLFSNEPKWSGGGAVAASGSLQKRIADLEARCAELKGCVDLFVDAYDAVNDAKSKIIEIVGEANSCIQAVQESC